MDRHLPSMLLFIIFQRSKLQERVYTPIDIDTSFLYFIGLRAMAWLLLQHIFLLFP